MYLLLNLLQVCCFTTIIKTTNGYVLLAANLDDFRSIAKKFVSEKFADQLTKMASQSNMKYRQELTNTGQYSSDDDSSETSSEADYVSDKKEEETKKRYVIKKQTINPVVKEPDIIIDAIVEKVRERLKSEYNKATQYNKSNVQGNVDREDKNTNTNQSMDNNNIKDRKINNKQKLNKRRPKNKSKSYKNNKNRNTESTKKDTDSKDDYADAFGETEEAKKNLEIEYEITDNTRKPTNQDAKKKIDDNEEEKETEYDLKSATDNRFFKGFDLAKNQDSYDDYVTPRKDDIFESDEATETLMERIEKASKEKFFNKIEKNPKTIALTALSSLGLEKDDKKDHDYTDYEKEEEIKGKTDSLWFDDSNVNATEGAHRKVKSRTMIPTKRYFTMSSPNYYAKLPVGAQKYNFDEPLPQKDREPEKSKPIPDPFANINGKVRLY